ncbi:hypothetical protein HZS_7166 [Henneguya salminicola]|nr:hypothetical protein HZS_7166 [Henneguya salminicola]
MKIYARAEIMEPPSDKHELQINNFDLNANNKTQFSILVNRNQEKNPVLKHIRNVPWCFSDGIKTDFMIGQGVGVYFISMKYHNIYQNYIHDRLKDHRNIYRLCILLVVCDIPEPEICLLELTKISLLTNISLILSWNTVEAAQYLETYKSYLNKPADSIMTEKSSQNIETQVIEFLTNIRGISKTNALVLLKNYKTLKHIMMASLEELSLCPGIGTNKGVRIRKFFNQTFYNEYNKK